jgi:hypothetical protein
LGGFALMTEIALRHDWEAWRSYVHHTRPWSDTARFYQERVAAGLQLQPLLQLVESIAASPVSGQIFGGTSMFDLLISDCEDFRTGEGVLHVIYRPGEHQFEFHHRAFSGQHDKKVCTEAEALQTLRLFLRVKFGVLYEIPMSNSTSKPN